MNLKMLILLGMLLAVATCSDRANSQTVTTASNTKPIAGRNPGAATAPMNFRIDIDIYTDLSKPPLTSIQTIFAAGQYVELDEANHRVTLVEPAKGRMTLLDTQRKLLCNVDLHSLDSDLNRILSKLTDEQRALFSSDGEPMITSDQMISIGNTQCRYEFRPITPSHPEIANSYCDFANWSTKLSAYYPPRRPPQMRLQLNQLLADQGQLPAELHRITHSNGKTEQIIARLILQESLTQVDRTKLERVQQWQTEFKPVSDKEFFQTTP